MYGSWKQHAVCGRVALRRLWSPGYGWHTSAILVDEVASGIEDPAVVERRQSMSGCGGCVFAILAVSVLQRRKLVLPQHFVHDKCPVGYKQSQSTCSSSIDTNKYFIFDKSPTRKETPCDQVR